MWRRTKLEVHRQIFKEKCNASSRPLFQSKQDYCSTNIIECENDTKTLYKLTNKLMGKNQDVALPTSDSDTELSNRFSDYFLGKIHIIRENLQKASETNDNVVNALRADVKFSSQHLTRLAPASSDKIWKLGQFSYICAYGPQISENWPRTIRVTVPQLLV